MKPTRLFIKLLLILGTLSAIAAPAAAQDDSEEKSRLIRFVEDKLSSPNRQISLNGIEGTLSSDVTFASITIADEEGVWLRIVRPRLQWQRTSLIRGRLQVESLTADRIEWPRMGAADESMPAPESSGFQVPELPVSVVIEQLNIQEAEFGEPVFGLASTLSLDGSLRLADGNFETSLAIERLDGPGGELGLDAAYNGESQQVDVDFSLAEPEDGILANLLNIPDRPSVALQVQGSGPINDLTVNLALQADDQDVATGTLVLDDTLFSDDRRLQLNVSGPIQRILPEQHREFFGSETSLGADVTIQGGGGITLHSIALDSGALDLAAAGSLLPGGFPEELTIDIDLGSQGGEPVRLPLSGPAITVGGGEIAVRYRTDGVEGWQLNGRLDAFDAPDVDIERIVLEGGGDVTYPADPDARSLTFDVTGSAEGIAPEDPGLAAATGERIDMTFSGGWQAGEPVRLANASIAAETFDVTAEGEIDGLSFDGEAQLEASDLAAFSLLADRPLGGSTSLALDGEIGLAGGGFDLTFDGSLTDAEVGDDIANRLLEGETALSGGAARTPEGLRFTELTLENPQLSARINGAYATSAADLTAEAVIEDIALIDERSSGRLTLDASVTKPEPEDEEADATDERPYTVEADLRLAEGELLSRNVPSAQLGFSGEIDTAGAIAGQVSGSGQIGGESIEISGGINRAESSLSISDFAARIGLSRILADLRVTDGIADGNVTIDSNDISALALTEASGAVNGEIVLENDEGRQNATADLEISGLRYGDYRVESADLQAGLADVLNQPKVNANIDARGVEAAGISVAQLTASANAEGDVTQFEADASLENGTDVETAGRFQPTQDGFTATLNALSIASSYGDADLVGDATFTRSGSTTTIEGFEARIAGGTVAVSGSIGDTMSLDARISALPLSIANSIRPDLELAGTLTGQVNVSGTADNPRAEFDVSGSDLTAGVLREASIAPIDLDARGQYVDQVVRIESFSARNDQRLNVTGSGSVPLPGADGEIDLTANINALPLAIANGFSPGLGLAGTLDGTVTASGTIDNPAADFNLRVTSLDAQAMRAAGLAPINATASGTYSGQSVNLRSLAAQNSQNLDLTASGTIPLAGSGLSLNVNGSAPLALAESFLAERGTQLSGTLRLDATVGGSLSSPSFDGLFSISGGSVTDPLTNVQLNGISGMAGLRGDTISINRLSAELASGGSIGIDGTIGLTGPLPANLTIRLDNAVYTDARTIRTTADGTLTVSGGLRAGPLIAGTINLDNTEITVPETLSGEADLLPVEHRNPDRGTLLTLQRLQAVTSSGDGGGGTSAPVRLDITVNSPNQIFVRGRGIDAEFGGSVRVTGSLSALRPVGGFTLIRGRLSILNERLELTEGRITLTGSLDPLIDIVAQVNGNEITAFVRLTGRASDLELDLSSSPELPEDEILARIIFGKSLTELSPLQIANLATAAASLASGGGGNSISERLRQGIGVDDLDVVQDEDGNVAVRAGKYIQENVYLDVQAGGSGGEVSINLDVTESLTAKGTVGTDGGSEIGVFFEKDY